MQDCPVAKKQLKIVTADDSEHLRELLWHTFLPEPGLSIVGTAADGLEALRVIRELKPDVVVLDISMPLMDGIEVLKEIRKDDHSTIIIMFTCHDSVALSALCRKLGANYFLIKTQLTKLVEICKDQLLAVSVGGPASSCRDVCEAT
jgi:Response regulator containing CheY-like receiver domain and AraC-type DNA-binding domain